MSDKPMFLLAGVYDDLAAAEPDYEAVKAGDKQARSSTSGRRSFAPTIAPTPRKMAPRTVISFGGDESALAVTTPAGVERSPSCGSDISLG